MKTTELLAAYLCKKVIYLPILGPVVIKNLEVTERIITDISKLKIGNSCLPYDKNLRWGRGVDEEIAEISETKSGFIIKTRKLKKKLAYLYGESIQRRDIPIGYDEVIVEGDLAIKGQRPLAVFKQDISQKHVGYENEKIIFLDLPDDKFSQFVGKLNDSGFSHFAEIWPGRNDLGLVVAYLHNDEIVGAIGPLEVQIDASGQKYLLPAYFGVIPMFYRQGIGTALWNASISWAAKNSAEYCLVQNSVGSPAYCFYKNSGLTEEYKYSCLSLRNRGVIKS